MRTFVLAGLLLTSCLANAALVTFEELAEDTSFVPSVTSQGFVFSGSFTMLVLSETDSEGNFVWSMSPPGSCCQTLEITRQDGLAFDLESMDLYGFGGPTWGGEYTVEGFDEFDQLVANSAFLFSDWDQATFDGAWNDISKVVITESTHYCGACMPTTSGIRLDNLMATAVPVPAAVWLFGSALAGLGWLRRKQTI